MKYKFILGIDLGATFTKIGLVNKRLNILEKLILSTRSYQSKEDLISAIVKNINTILIKRKIKRTEILGVGIGTPGLVDSRKGFIHFLTNIPGWKKVNLKRLMQRRIHLPVFVDNDVNLMALAEYRCSLKKDINDIVCLTLGTGVGGAIIINGQLYRGSSFSAGEIGHTPLNEEGPECNCGGMACLERYIGNKQILNAAKRYIDKKITLEKLSELAKKGDKKAIKIWQEVGRKLGIALAGIINLLNPQVIIIGGGIAQAGEVLFSAIKKTIKKRAMDLPAKKVKIIKARLGQDAGIIGAAILVQDNLGGRI